MSHEAGFRRGGRDFSHKAGPARSRKPRGGKAFEQRMAKRFHEHEKDVQARAAETDDTEADEDSTDED